MTITIRILLLADTHLGFDFPLRPRVERRRRGLDFFANTRRALEPALNGQVDVVIHGGDLLFRSKVPARMVSMAFEPLIDVADTGIPVVVVPGNHERSSIPYPLLAAHENLHILHQPTTVTFPIGGLSLAVAGFPCVRNGIADSFRDLTGATGVLERNADIKVLCMHQSVEGATVGPSNFVFRSGPDIVRGCDLPTGLAAVLSGHIHRAQTLTTDLAGRRLPSPVFYSGSIERTSYAERNEEKGFMILELTGNNNGGRVVRSDFHQLPTRPLEDLEIDVEGLSASALETTIQNQLSCFDAEAVVRVRFRGSALPEARMTTTAATLRRLAPPSMTITISRPS